MSASKKMPCVDIIIPVYNTPLPFLKRCIESALGQSYDNIQIIIVDDGSTTRGTLLVLDHYSNNKRCRIVRQRHLGVSTARNTGLEQSIGDYVFFLDSDDYLKASCVANLVTTAELTQTNIVFGGMINTSSGKNVAPFRKKLIDLAKDSEAIVIKAHAFVNNSVLIDGDIARKVRFTTTTTTTGEDTEYMVKAMSLGKCYYDGGGEYYYVQNPNSITRSVSIEKVERYLKESILLNKTFERYLQAALSAINTFQYLKLLRAYQKLYSIASMQTATRIAKGHIKRYRLRKPPVWYVMRSKFLTNGEKIKIILISNRVFSVIYVFWYLKDRWNGRHK